MSSIGFAINRPLIVVSFVNNATIGPRFDLLDIEISGDGPVVFPAHGQLAGKRAVVEAAVDRGQHQAVRIEDARRIQLGEHHRRTRGQLPVLRRKIEREILPVRHQGPGHAVIVAGVLGPIEDFLAAVIDWLGPHGAIGLPWAWAIVGLTVLVRMALVP